MIKKAAFYDKAAFVIFYILLLFSDGFSDTVSIFVKDLHKIYSRLKTADIHIVFSWVHKGHDPKSVRSNDLYSAYFIIEAFRCKIDQMLRYDH